jgi:hypothetical protein
MNTYSVSLIKDIPFVPVCIARSAAVKMGGLHWPNRHPARPFNVNDRGGDVSSSTS